MVKWRMGRRRDKKTETWSVHSLFPFLQDTHSTRKRFFSLLLWELYTGTLLELQVKFTETGELKKKKVGSLTSFAPSCMEARGPGIEPLPAQFSFRHGKGE